MVQRSTLGGQPLPSPVPTCLNPRPWPHECTPRSVQETLVHYTEPLVCYILSAHKTKQRDFGTCPPKHNRSSPWL